MSPRARPYIDALVVAANLRAWGRCCAAEPEPVERLVARARRGSR